MNFKEIINNRYALYIFITIILFVIYYNSMKTPLTDIEIKSRNEIENFESDNVNNIENNEGSININLRNIENIKAKLFADSTINNSNIIDVLTLIEKKIPLVEKRINDKLNDMLEEYKKINNYKAAINEFYPTKYNKIIADNLSEFEDYNITTELQTEITLRIIETQKTNLLNIESTYKTPEVKEPSPTQMGVFMSSLDNLETGIDNMEIIELRRNQYIYLLTKLGLEDEELSQTITNSTNIVVEDFTVNSNNITSFDGLSTVQLNKIKDYNNANKSPYSHETLLIDPLKIISNVQDDTISLLEKTFQKYEPTDTTNGNITTSTNPTTTQEGFDASNRGSYLTNSPTDKIVNPHVANLSYSSKQAEQPKYLSSQSKVFTTLKEKESDIAEIKSRVYADTEVKEGFEDGTTATDAKKSSSSTIKLFDGFIKYSANILTDLIKLIINFDVNELDTSKLTSYGVVLIIISVILYFISISS